MFLPEDVNVLVSLINMKLRDNCILLEDFCDEEDIDVKELTERLKAGGFIYDEENNRFS